MPELSATTQHWVSILLVWIGFGSLAGLVARVILPLREPSRPLATLTLGITGSAVGLLILSLWQGEHTTNPLGPIGFLAATAGALGLLVGYRLLEAVVPHHDAAASDEDDEDDDDDDDEDDDDDDDEDDDDEDED